MEDIKHELQHIIFGDEQAGGKNPLKKIQSFLRGYAETSRFPKKQQPVKGEEAIAILEFASAEKLFYDKEIPEDYFVGEGAEQKVYRLNQQSVIKTNGGLFYETWLDYFNSLLIHNFFFPATAYEFLGVKLIEGELHAVVQQKYVITTESTDLQLVENFLLFNGFLNVRNNDYINRNLGLIFEDLHDENVISSYGVLFFIDTIFYLMPEFYQL